MQRMTSSTNEPVNLRSRVWVQSSLKQPSLLNDASTSCFATLELRPTSNAGILLQHIPSSREDTKTHTDYSSPTLPQRASLFMSVGLCLLFTSGVQWAACASVVADSVTPMFTGTSGVLFLLCLVSLCFSCHVILSFEPRSLKRQRHEKKKELTPGCTSQSWKNNNGRGHSQVV